VAADVLRARAHELAERLSRRSPAVVREIKRLVYDAGTRRLRAGIAMEEASMLATASQPDAIKAMEAYHGHVGPFEQASTQAIVNAWDRLHDGHLVEFRR